VFIRVTVIPNHLISNVKLGVSGTREKRDNTSDMKVETDLKKIKEAAENKEDFVFRLIGVVGNYDVCPIVFNVYEQLKAELWHV